jgi:hypothetical protein
MQKNRKVGKSRKAKSREAETQKSKEAGKHKSNKNTQNGKNKHIIETHKAISKLFIHTYPQARQQCG